MGDHEITRCMAMAESLIAKLDNRHHRRILENYRMHAFLELSGRFEEIMSPELTVDQPIYRINTPEGVRVYDGRDAVLNEFYGALARAKGTYIRKEQEHIAVADWGFSQEQLVHYPMSGAAAKALGHEVDDLDAMYVEDRWVSMQWHYTPDAKLIGENVYRAPVHSFRKVPSERFPTQEEVRAALAPLIAEGAFRKD
jgi:hypothetical protein